LLNTKKEKKAHFPKVITHIPIFTIIFLYPKTHINPHKFLYFAISPLPFLLLTHKLGRRRYDMKQSGFGGQTKPIFHKKAKTTKKIALRLECTVCKRKRMNLIKRCKTVILIDASQKKQIKNKDRLYK
jgi:hypothetical protein